MNEVATSPAKDWLWEALESSATATTSTSKPQVDKTDTGFSQFQFMNSDPSHYSSPPVLKEVAKNSANDWLSMALESSAIATTSTSEPQLDETGTGFSQFQFMNTDPSHYSSPPVLEEVAMNFGDVSRPSTGLGLLATAASSKPYLDETNTGGSALRASKPLPARVRLQGFAPVVNPDPPHQSSPSVLDEVAMNSVNGCASILDSLSTATLPTSKLQVNETDTSSPAPRSGKPLPALVRPQDGTQSVTNPSGYSPETLDEAGKKAPSTAVSPARPLGQSRVVLPTLAKSSHSITSDSKTISPASGPSASKTQVNEKAKTRQVTENNHPR